MSQHNITGSEVFGPRPYVILRGVPNARLRARRGRIWLGFAAGVATTAIGGAATAFAMMTPGLLG